MAVNPYPINVPVGTGLPIGTGTPVYTPQLPPPTGSSGSSLAQQILAGLKTAQPYLEAGARTAAAASAGRAAGRTAEADTAKSQYDLESQAYKDAIKNAIRGSFGQGLTDFSVTPPPGVHMGTVTGGLRPSSIPDMGKIGALQESDAMKTVLQGSPEVPTLPQATGLDKGLNLAALIGGGTSLAGALLKQGAGQALNYGVNKGIGAAANAVGGGAATGASGAGGGAGGGAGAASGGGGMFSTSPATLGLGAGIGIGGNIAAQYLPAGAPRTAGSYASTGASIGSAAGPAGMAIGAGVGAIIGAIKGHQNHTKGQRDEFAQALGFGKVDDLYTALSKVGPEGVKLVDEGLHIIGKNDFDQNASWMERAAAALGVH